MFRKRTFWIGLILLLALASGGGYIYYHRVYRPSHAVAEQTITTAQVRRGDLVVSVSGSGELNPASEVELGFQVDGYLDEVLVQVGDRVQEGDVLARLETGDLELAVSEAEIKARLAQLSLEDAREGPTDAELANARAALQSAQDALLVAQYTFSSTLNSALDAAVRSRYLEYQRAAEQYWAVEEQFADGDASQSRYDEVWNERGAAEGQLGDASRQADMEGLDNENQLYQAQNRVYQAWENLQLLQSEPTTETVMRAELAADQAALALDDARDNLAAAELRAPFAGIVVDVEAIPGERVGAATVITLADLEEPLLCLWVEESDAGGVAVGDRVEAVFDALPDDTFTGEIARVDPALVTVDGTLAVQAWASLDVASQQANLLGSMNADVEVISAESRDTLIAPLQALRELGQGQYAVFVVQPDGEMELRPVEVGLMDFVNAEILSGLEVGEIVSTGVEESTDTNAPQEELPPGNPMMRMLGG